MACSIADISSVNGFIASRRRPIVCSTSAWTVSARPRFASSSGWISARQDRNRSYSSRRSACTRRDSATVSSLMARARRTISATESWADFRIAPRVSVRNVAVI